MTPAGSLSWRRANVLGVGVSAINMDDAVRAVDLAIEARRKGYICVTCVNVVMTALRDPEFKRILNASLLSTPDGMPTVWVGKRQGFSKMRRVFGPEFMLRVCEASVSKGYRHFLYGGAPGVAEQLRTVLERRYPGVRVVGTYTPPYRPLCPGEEAEVSALFAKLQPDICWVGLGAPKQERFMAEYLPKLDTLLMAGVGAAFDFHTGRIQDSPDWVKNAGLQWLHRLIQEPARLWRRYLMDNPEFAINIALQLSGLRKYEMPGGEQ